MYRLCLFIFLLLSQPTLAADQNKFFKFTQLLVGDAPDPENAAYNQQIKLLSLKFEQNFTKPLREFEQEQLKLTGETLFYPFAGADITYPLLLFPHFKQYILVGLEIIGNPSFIDKKFSLNSFAEQAQGYLSSGFFKTMNMSAQIHHQQGVIPMLALQIGLQGGVVDNITLINEAFNGAMINFTYNNSARTLYYFRANLDDSIDKLQFFDFIMAKKIDACMLKASSYKLQQTGFAQLDEFMLKHCPSILQDDTGISFAQLKKHQMKIRLFGNYIKPYGEEFKPYYQKDLQLQYLNEQPLPKVSFCYGYGCARVEANLLLAHEQLQ